ncbi:MAG: hypothetical protein KF784_07585 [Fimbriimonadaceae bacterium]|nr:hypothetical protein [Fimbriimonadaceae bacterium]
MADVVFSNSRAYLYTFYFLRFALLVLLLLALLVLEFAVIDDSAHGRLSSGGDDNQVKAFVFSPIEGLSATYDSYGGAISGDQSNFWKAQDAPVDEGTMVSTTVTEISPKSCYSVLL